MSDKDIILFGFDISKLTRRSQFLICVSGVFICFLLYGYCQELIFNIEGFKPYGWYLTFVQFIFYTLLSSTESLFNRKDTKRRIPLKTYFLLAFLTVGTMGMSNASLGYLNYPTQVIFKSCKLIPVMIGGIIIQRKTYGLVDFLCCILMSIGLAFFILADSTLQPSFNFIGVGMMVIALSSDAAIGNVQEKAMKEFNANNTEVVLYSYGIGTLYLSVILLLEGTLKRGFFYFADHPFQKYGYSLLFSLSGYIGINFVLSLIQCFGALLAVTVTTCRKAITIIISFITFTKPFTFQYVWSGMLVLLGIILNVYKKNKSVVDVKILNYFQMLVNSFGHQNHRHSMAQTV